MNRMIQVLMLAICIGRPDHGMHTFTEHCQLEVDPAKLHRIAMQYLSSDQRSGFAGADSVRTRHDYTRRHGSDGQDLR